MGSFNDFRKEFQDEKIVMKITKRSGDSEIQITSRSKGIFTDLFIAICALAFFAKKIAPYMGGPDQVRWLLKSMIDDFDLEPEERVHGS